jgi:hypothetical protein
MSSDVDPLEEARIGLQTTVDFFNGDFQNWEEDYECGANFHFKYDPESGRKRMEISDLAPINPRPEPKAVEQAGEEISKALNPEAQELRDKLHAKLKTAARAAASQILLKLVTQEDIMVLGILGVDAQSEILDVLMRECQLLKGEPKDAPRTRRQKA